MRWRLFFAFFAAIILSVLLLGFGFRQNTLRVVNDFILRGGVAGVDHIATALEEHYAVNHSWNQANYLLSLPIPSPPGKGGGKGPRHSRNIQLAIITPDGILIDRSNQESPYSQDTLDSAVALHENGQIVGYLIPQNGSFAIYDRYEDRLATQFNKAAIQSIMITGSISLLLSLVAGYFMLRPVRKLTEAAENLAQGDLSSRVSIKGRDEFARLGQSFNRMAESLEHAEENRRMLTADIAHELRTPLAVQRANLEALQDGVYPLTLENIQLVIDQNHLLTHLVDDLRLLALTDSQALQLDRHSTNIVNLLSQIITQSQSQANQKDIELIYMPPAHCSEISIDPRRVEQILNNLIQNALDHTPDEGHINFSLICQPDTIILTIEDTGPGIPKDSIPYIFDRFYRADQSRAREYGGSGLGLTIARQLARAHGGDLTADNLPQGGASFTLTLPRPESL